MPRNFLRPFEVGKVTSTWKLIRPVCKEPPSRPEGHILYILKNIKEEEVATNKEKEYIVFQKRKKECTTYKP